jgi:hypothetical protein
VSDEHGQYEQWEHYVEFVTADSQYDPPFVQQFYPQGRAPVYAIQSILPRLNYLGEQGWQLVNIQPVRLGGNGDVMMESGGSREWNNAYLCAFKRRRNISGTSKE